MIIEEEVVVVAAQDLVEEEVVVVAADIQIEGTTVSLGLVEEEVVVNS